MASWGIVESELIEWLGSYGGPRYHAIISDPPYALISITKRFGKAGSAPAQEGSDGRYSRLSTGFMGQKWDGFESLEHYQKWVSEWSELMIQRLLYPGAVCLFFGGTRTFHHLGVGLENGGFEIVDSILIPWLHGQGFPKSHDVSKGMDKAAGEERTEVIGTKPGHEEFIDRKTKGDSHFGSGLQGFERPWMQDDEARKRYHQKLAPVTENAETWDGYGTALKPAWEPVFVCRAPRRGLTRTWTFAELATEFGTGALNIDGARISGSPESTRFDPDKHSHEGYRMNASGEETAERAKQVSGRWPANFALSHHDDCISMGEVAVRNPSGSVSGEEPSDLTKHVYGEYKERQPFDAHGKKVTHYRRKGRTINRFTEGMKPFGDAEGEEYETVEFTEELIERWACVPECPVRTLDNQAGNLDVVGGPKNTHSPKASIDFGGGAPSVIYRDVGGPSRFFYTAKASRSEKDKGLEHFWWKRIDDGFERVSLSEYEKLDKRERAHGCIHPTVKPLELLRYLSTLVLPPKQEGRIRRILIPFSGSGSEMIGALQAGWDEVQGIEMESNYVMMAEARIKATIGMF